MATWDAQSLAVVIAASAAALSGVIAAIRLSRCTSVDCLCFHVRREVPNAPESTPPENMVRSQSGSLTSLTSLTAPPDASLAVV
jgi:hypothetical protein